MKTEKRSAVRERLAGVLGLMVHEHKTATGEYQADLAAAAGISPAYLSLMLEHPQDKPLPTDVMVGLTRLTGDDRLVALVAELCGGLFVPLPQTDPRVGFGEAVHAARAAVTATAAAVDALLHALEDGRVTQAEVAGLELAATSAAVSIQALVRVGRELAGRPLGGTQGRARTLADAERM